MSWWRRTVSAAACVALVSCAVTPQEFYANRTSYSPVQVCRIWREGDDTVGAAAAQEAARRGLSVERCRALLAEADKNSQAAVLGGVFLLSLLAIAAGGSGAPPSAIAPVHVDTEWAWDQFYNEQNVLVWACRGVQTGQFHPLVRCQYLPQVDARWPGQRLY